MPTECAHATCRNLKVKGNGVSFHHFPKNPERRKRWASLMGRPEGWAPSQWDLVCGAHFREEDFDKTGQTIRLREGVEPSLFDTSSHRKKSLKTRKMGKNRKRLCNASSDSKNEQDSAGVTSAKSQRLNKGKDLRDGKQHSLGLTSVKPQAAKKCNHQDTADGDEQVQLASTDEQQTENQIPEKPQTPNKLKNQRTETSFKRLHNALSDSNTEEECPNLTSPKRKPSNCNHQETTGSDKQLQHTSSDAENEQHPVSLTTTKPDLPNSLKPPATACDSKQLCPVSSTSKRDQYFLKLTPDKPQTPKFHTYSADTEKTFKTKWLRAEKRAEELEKQLHNSLKREKRRKTLLAALTEELKDKNSLIDKLQAKLDLYADFPIELFVAKSAYTEEQKEFAVTLHHYGPKAYEYLQTKVKLPTTRTVRRWLSDKDGSPAVHSSVIDALKAKIEQNKNSH